MAEFKELREGDDRAYGKRWIKAPWFCMNCGAHDTWQYHPGDGGDYYHDCMVTCHSCGHDMCCVEQVQDVGAHGN